MTPSAILTMSKIRIYKHRIFAKWAKNEGVGNTILQEAIHEIEQGLFNANLGGNLYKKRIAKKGQGKSGGYRTFIAFKQGDRAIFVFGFAKNELDNIHDEELNRLKKLGQEYLTASIEKIYEAITENRLIEVK